jgi:hypothetical protein
MRNIKATLKVAGYTLVGAFGGACLVALLAWTGRLFPAKDPSGNPNPMMEQMIAPSIYGCMAIVFIPVGALVGFLLGLVAASKKP